MWIYFFPESCLSILTGRCLRWHPWFYITVFWSWILGRNFVGMIHISLLWWHSVSEFYSQFPLHYYYYSLSLFFFSFLAPLYLLLLFHLTVYCTSSKCAFLFHVMAFCTSAYPYLCFSFLLISIVLILFTFYPANNNILPHLILSFRNHVLLLLHST